MLTKETITLIQSDIADALRAVAAKHNLTLAKHHISYGADNFRLTAEFGDKSELGDINPLYKKDLIRNGWIHGLLAEHLSKEFKMGARTYQFYGMRGRVNAIVKNVADGKMYKMDPKDVAAALGAAGPKLTEVKFVDQFSVKK